MFCKTKLASFPIMSIRSVVIQDRDFPGIEGIPSVVGKPGVTLYFAGDKPHLRCNRRSKVLKTKPSTTYPMAMISSITAIT